MEKGEKVAKGEKKEKAAKVPKSKSKSKPESDEFSVSRCACNARSQGVVTRDVHRACGTGRLSRSNTRAWSHMAPA